MDRNIRMVADAMKLTALVGQVDVKFDLSKETETGGRET